MARGNVCGWQGPCPPGIDFERSRPQNLAGDSSEWPAKLHCEVFGLRQSSQANTIPSLIYLALGIWACLTVLWGQSSDPPGPLPSDGTILQLQPAVDE